jgi:hypothetical protein
VESIFIPQPPNSERRPPERGWKPAREGAKEKAEKALAVEEGDAKVVGL